MLKRTPIKRTPFKAQRAPIKRVSEKKHKENIDKILENHKMIEAFYQYWCLHPHKCESCGKYLGHELKTYMIDHLLEKSKYPELRCESLNFFLVCFECHEKKTNGHPTPEHQKAIDKVKEIFSIY